MNRDLQNTKSLTHLDTSLTSLKDMKSLIYEQFQEQLTKTNYKTIQPTEYEKILNELKNYKMQQIKLKQKLEKQLTPLLFQEQCQINSCQTQSQNSKHETDQFEMEYEQQIMLEEQLKNLRSSTDLIRKKTHPLGHQISLLKLQERQALDEEQLAQFEMKKISQLKQQLRSQLEGLKYQREQYLDFVRQQCQDKEHGRKIIQQNFEQQQMKVEALKEVIRTQQSQIEDLNQQQQDKIEQSEQQLITIKNYQSILKIYEYCINLTEKLELSIDKQEDQINSLENIPQPTILPTLESDTGINNFFQTQIPIETAQPVLNSIHSSVKKRRKSLLIIENQKLMVSQVRQDISINIMEEIVLKNFKEELMIQSQYSDQHTQMVDQIYEYQQEIKLLDEQLAMNYDFTDKLVDCEVPQVDNFNQNVITKNIQKTSIVNYLEKIKQIDKQNKIEELFFTLNSRAYSLVKRLCCMLEDIYKKSENISRTVIKTFQRILNTINLMKEQNMNFDLSEYPEFRQMLKSKNLTIIYCDVKIFEQYKLSLPIINEETLIENFDLLCDLCLAKIANETQFIYEQIISVYLTLRDEVERLLNYGSLKSCRDLNNIPIQIQLTNNQAAKKIKEYQDSKFSDLTSNRRAKLIFVKDNQVSQPFLDSLINEDNIDDFYYKVKKDLAFKPDRKTTHTDNCSQSKTTLIYENISNQPMQELVRQNKKFSDSIKHIQQQSQYIDDRTQKLREFLEGEQRNLENMSKKGRKLSRAPSSSLGLLTTNRPDTQERTIKIEKRQISTANKFRSQNRVISEQFQRDSNRLRQKMQKIQQLKLNI